MFRIRFHQLREQCSTDAESANHVIHCYGRKRFRHKSTDYLKKYEGVLREYPFGKKKKSKSSIVSLFRINSVLVEPA